MLHAHPSCLCCARLLQHWQTHLMRLHCLRGLGQLQSSRAVESHQNVCWHLKEACKQAKHIQAYPYMCDNKGHGGTARVRLLDEPFVNTTMPASDKDASRSTPPMKTKRHQGTMYEPAGRGMYGRHLQSSVARRKLRDARYVVLRKLFPSAVISLLQAWYKELDRTLDETAVFQEKTQRHEYLPEVVSTYLNLALVPFASAMTGTVVAPTYPFPITYIPGGSIHPHLDVSDNELSITFQVLRLLHVLLPHNEIVMLLLLLMSLLPCRCTYVATGTERVGHSSFSTLAAKNCRTSMHLMQRLSR